MQSPLRRPEEILAYRSLRQMLGSVARPVRAVARSDNVLAAINLMSERDIGFVPVLESGRLVGVLSERDCVRGVTLARRPADATAVGDVMVRNLADRALK